MKTTVEKNIITRVSSTDSQLAIIITEECETVRVSIKNTSDASEVYFLLNGKSKLSDFTACLSELAGAFHRISKDFKKTTPRETLGCAG